MTAHSTGNADSNLAHVEAILAVLVIIITLSAMRLSLFLWPEEARASVLTAREMRQDLYLLRRELDAHSAFLTLDEASKSAQIDAYIKAMASRYPDQIPSTIFGAEVLKIMNILQDPGTGTGPEAEFGQRLPIVPRALDDRWLALDDSLNAWDEDHPFISHIDDVPLSRWQEATQAFLPGSSKYSLTSQAQWLRRIALLRHELGLSAKPSVTLTLTSLEGQVRRVTLQLLPDEPPVTENLFSIKPLGEKANLITLTNIDEIEHNRSHQKQFQQAMAADLLVLDLRAAQGESPALLTILGAYADSDDPLIGFARYRASASKRNDYLGTDAYRAADSGPTLAGDDAHVRFGQWFVRSQPKGPKVTGRLAVIAGPGCRQECEWIVHSAKQWQRAIIIGEDTMGDLGKLHRLRLPNLKQEFFFSSSLAYARDGSLISGAGTSPDIWVPGQEAFDAEGLLALIGELPSSDGALEAKTQDSDENAAAQEAASDTSPAASANTAQR
ncbi:hypothetical protein KJI95_04075 [Shewanella sp. JM162201]|uniref:Tail specific protease domain-containing protein n=1 Tax=Shewanella jiangmenensis TaxID=2837387 RepID=A0ABS5V1K4_9GAMM|nr:S41 family peptidase [Shewanella jiangmenensis]MBT1443702.1 hypothetical protein [Shewanella jiangmenensis]